MVIYDSLAQHYYERRNDKTRFDYNRDIEVPALIKMIGKVKNKTVLDLGCEFGDHALKLKQYKKLYGMDLSKELIKFAHELQLPRTEFLVGDMDKKLPFAKLTFDIVCSGLAIHYVKNLKKLFSEVNRVLKKGGCFCFSTGHPIFNLMNQSKQKIDFTNNYFDESSKLNDLGTLGMVKMYNYTFETIISSGLKAGFELVEYKEPKPVKGSRKFGAKQYDLRMRLPAFILFKFKKH